MSGVGLPVLSPLVTRIIELSGFSPELKTRDIQAVFAPWEDDRGGFKIKWLDDTSVLIIFADPAVAKKAYLQVLMSPPASLNDATGKQARIRPYDGDDASQVIASVHHRTRSRSNAANLAGSPGSPSQGLRSLPNAPGSGSAHEFSTSPPSQPGRHRHAGSNVSLSGLSTAGSLSRATGAGFKPGHLRNPSGSNPSSLPAKPVAAALYDASKGGPSPAQHLTNAAREQGVPLPPVPTDAVMGPRANGNRGHNGHTASTSAPASSKATADAEGIEVLSEDASSPPTADGASNASTGVRVGDAGKRLVAGALGVRHPGLASGAAKGDAAPASGDAEAAVTLPQGMEDLTIR